MLNNKRYLIIAILLIAGLLRFYNLMHDSPYFFNPDERNMAIAITQFRLPSDPSQIPICLISQISPKNDPGSSSGSNDPGSSVTNNCNLNPHFFAYSQFPFYLSFVSDRTVHFISSITNKLPVDKTNLNTNEIQTTTFPAAIFWLRFYSALSSTLTVLLVYLISRQFFTFNFSLITATLVAFTPGLIQAAHFGTTESVLTFFFMASVYLSISNLSHLSHLKFILLTSLSIGFALGSKLTGIFFFVPPVISLMIRIIALFKKRSKKKIVTGVFVYLIVGLLVFMGSISIFILASPYNLVAWRDFISAVFGYEKDVATGVYPAFYTTQFIDTTPIIFQAQKVFPYVLGWPIFILGSSGLLMMVFNIISDFFHKIIQSIKYYVYPSYSGLQQLIAKKLFRWVYTDSNLSLRSKLRIRHKNNNILTAYLPAQAGYFLLTTSFLIYLIPNVFLYAKWTRFMTPIMPFFSIFAGYTLFIFLSSRPKWRDLFHQPYGLRDSSTRQAKFDFARNDKIIKLVYLFICLFVITSILPGLMFMSIYTHPDTRLQASYWIYDNIPDNSYVLSETANVVDIPLGLPNNESMKQWNNSRVISFDFYHLDENPLIFERLLSDLEKADYIFIPSRRLFTNYTRLSNKYPRLNRYYQLLFSGALGFTKVAEFSSFPNLTLNALRFTLPDENAEETYTVFDHPVVRIYKKTRPMTIFEYEYLLKG